MNQDPCVHYSGTSTTDTCIQFYFLKALDMFKRNQVHHSSICKSISQCWFQFFLNISLGDPCGQKRILAKKLRPEGKACSSTQQIITRGSLYQIKLLNSFTDEIIQYVYTRTWTHNKHSCMKKLRSNYMLLGRYCKISIRLIKLKRKYNFQYQRLQAT